MKIQRVKIHNWRSIKDVDVSFEDLMVFIGQNNHGKSNILSAILFFFGIIPCVDLDYNKGCDDLFVEVLFGNLDDHDKAQFSKYLTIEGTILVRKQIKRGETYEYHGYTQIPSEDWLKEENAPNYTTRAIAEATPLTTHLPTGRLSKDAIKQAQQDYIAANAGSLTLRYQLETSNFLGLKSVAQGIFGEVFFIPAVKNASDEFNLKGKSVFNQLLTNVINDMSATNSAYIAVKDQVKALTQTLNKTVADGSVNPGRPEQIARLEELLESELASWDTKIDIEITAPDVDEVLRMGTNVWLDDGVATDVNRKGHGLQRSLIFALIKAWAKVSQEQRDAEDSEEEEGESTKRKASKSTYFIFEEPELYLHPQAQRELYSSLKKLSETNNQVLLSTHSSSFIDLGLYKSICVVYKNNMADGTKHLQCVSDIFTAIPDKKKFNITYWINPDRSELFFAKKVILLEGQTEKSVIPYLAKQLGCFRYDYTLIDCGSKDNIPLYIHLLNSFKLKYTIVYDQDHQAGKDANGIATATASSAAIESKIDTAYGSSVILLNDIEEEVGIAPASNKSKPHLAMEHVSNPGFTITPAFEAKVRQVFS